MEAVLFLETGTHWAGLASDSLCSSGWSLCDVPALTLSVLEL